MVFTREESVESFPEFTFQIVSSVSIRSLQQPRSDPEKRDFGTIVCAGKISQRHHGIVEVIELILSARMIL